MSRRMAWRAFRVSFRITALLAWELVTSLRKTKRRVSQWTLIEK